MIETTTEQINKIVAAIKSKKIYGNEDECNVGMRAMKTYNNSLIAGVVNGQTGCEIWEYCVSGK